MQVEPELFGRSAIAARDRNDQRIVLVLMKHTLKLTVERIGDRHSVLRQGMTSPSHGGNTGSNPVGDANNNN
jgi:hypothetical protein